MRDDERIDESIDAALRSYAEPVEMPETRVAVAQVMVRVRSQRERRVGWWVWGAVAAAFLAVALAMGAMWRMGGSREAEIAWKPAAPGVLQVPMMPKESATNRVWSMEARDRSRSPRRPQLRIAALPKLEVFPAPRALSPQEQALLAFASEAPAGVRQAVIEDQQYWDTPIVVAEVKIRPLGEDEQQSVGQKSNLER